MDNLGILEPETLFTVILFIGRPWEMDEELCTSQCWAELRAVLFFQPILFVFSYCGIWCVATS